MSKCIFNFLAGKMMLIILFFLAGSPWVRSIPLCINLYFAAGLVLFVLNFDRTGISLRCKPERRDILLVIVGMVYFGFHLLRNLMPVMSFDPLMYHFSLPCGYLSRNLILPDLDIPWSFYPPGSQFLYGSGFVLFGETGAKLVNLCTGIFSVLCVYCIAEKLYKKFAIYSVMTFITMPLIGFANIKSGNENFEIFTLLCFACCIPDSRKHFSHLFISSLLLLFLKYTYLVILPCVVFSDLIYMHLAKKKKGFSAVAAVICAMAVFSPVLIRNYLITGNPVYPLKNALFESSINKDVEGFGTNTLTEDYGLESNLFDYLRLPWNVVTNEKTFNYEWNGTGFILLAVFPVWFLKKSGDSLSSRRIVLVGIMYLLVWVISMPHILRFALPGIVLTMFCLSSAARSLSHGNSFLYRAFIGMFILSITAFPNWPNHFSGKWRNIDFDVITGKTDRMDYFDRKEDFLFNNNNVDFIRWSNKSFDGEKLYTSEEIRPYYIDRKITLKCIRWCQQTRFILNSKDASEIKECAKNYGIEYFVIQYMNGKMAWDLLNHPVWGNLDKIRENFSIVFQNGNFMVLKLY